jgi:hypothetical protein
MSEFLISHGEAVVSFCKIATYIIGPCMFALLIWAFYTIDLTEDK